MQSVFQGRMRMIAAALGQSEALVVQEQTTSQSLQKSSLNNSHHNIQQSLI